MLDPVLFGPLSSPCFACTDGLTQCALTDFKIALYPILVTGSPSHLNKEYSVSENSANPRRPRNDGGPSDCGGWACSKDSTEWQEAGHFHQQDTQRQSHVQSFQHWSSAFQKQHFCAAVLHFSVLSAYSLMWGNRRSCCWNSAHALAQLEPVHTNL